MTSGGPRGSQWNEVTGIGSGYEKSVPRLFSVLAAWKTLNLYIFGKGIKNRKNRLAKDSFSQLDRHWSSGLMMYYPPA